MANEIERVVLSRVADSKRIDFSEAALEAAGVARLTLEDLGAESVVNGAQRELIARVKDLEVKHGKRFDEAFRYVCDSFPNLVRVARLEKTRSKSAVVVVADE